MTEAVPNLWPKKFSRGVMTPLAVLRVQAAKFKEMTDGLLDAEVTTTDDTDDENEQVQIHSLELVAPALDSYRRTILTAQHAKPGAYPVSLYSDFIDSEHRDWEYYEGEEMTVECGTQAELYKRLGDVFGSPTLATLIESLIAQINDAEAVPTSA